MHAASNYQTEHLPPDKLKTSSERTRAATHWVRIARVTTLLAFSFAVLTVFQTSGSHAGSAGKRTATAPTPIATSPATASTATPTVERELALSFLSAAPFQLATESVQTYEGDCMTPKEDFTLGDTICAKATVPIALFRRINIIGPANVVRASAVMSGTTDTLSFVIPTTEQTTIGGEIFDNRGTWRADLSTVSFSRRATAPFDVSASTLAADLEMVAGIDGSDTVNSGDSLRVTVLVFNAGPDAAANVIVTPPSNEGLELQSFAPDGGNDCEGSTCTIESLGDRITAKFIATYEVTAPNGTKLAGIATVESDTEDPQPGSNSDTILVTVGTVDPDQTCTLSCPADVVVNANTTFNGELGAFVTYSAGVGVGDCGAVSNSPASGSFFTVGSHTVSSTSETGGGSCSFIVKVLNTPAPTISCPANRFATDTDSSGDENVAVGEPTVTASGGSIITSERSDSTPAVLDENGNVITPSVPKALTDPYPVGLTSILWTVTDGDGRTASCTQTVTVAENNCGSGTDTTPPTITSGPNLTFSTGADFGACGLIVGETDLREGLEASDGSSNCPVSISVTGVPAGNFFPVGTTTITWRATDAAGNTATDTQTVTILENTPPIIFAPADASFTCPENVPAASASQAGGPLLDSSGAPVIDDNGNFVPGGQPFDNCGTPTVTVTESSSGAGTSASPRVILRTFTATDASGNTASDVQTITVIDDTAPVLSCTQPNIVLEPSCPSGAIATYIAPVGTDNCANPTTVRTAGLASGSVFPIGTTTVTHTVTDWAGNSASCSFTVTVLTPQQTIQNMIASVQALQPPLTGTQVQGLNSKLQAALDAINQGKTNVACNKLNDFISQVTGFINNGTLTSAQGQPLITSAAKVRNTLGCTNNPCT